jgi:hypothetical protein
LKLFNLFRIGETEENSDDYYLAFHVNSATMKPEFVSCGPGMVFDPAARKGSFKRFILIILTEENAKQLLSAVQRIPSLKSKKDELVENKDYYLYVWKNFTEKFESKQKDLERTVCNELAEAANLQSASRPTRRRTSLLAGSELNGFFNYSKEDSKTYLIYPPELEATVRNRNSFIGLQSFH